MHRRGKSIPIAVHSHFDPGIGDHGYDGGDRAICGNHTASVTGEEESPKAADRVADGEDRRLVTGQSFGGADLLVAGSALAGAGNAVGRCPPPGRSLVGSAAAPPHAGTPHTADAGKP